jgi:hypothetical protein
MSTKTAVFWVLAVLYKFTKVSDTLVNFYQTTHCYNPEDSHLRKVLFHTECTQNKFLCEDCYSTCTKPQTSADSTVYIFTGWSESQETLSCHMSYLSKKALKSENKENVILCAGNVHCIQQCMNWLLSSCQCLKIRCHSEHYYTAALLSHI